MFLKKYNFLILFIFFIIFSCDKKDTKEINKNILDLESSLSISNKELESPFIVNAVPLEFTDDSILGNNISIIDISSEFIIVKSSNIIYIFDATGKYLSKIDKKGQGPEEYLMISDVLVDTKKQEVSVLDYYNNTVKVYDFKGYFISDIPNVKLMSYEKINDELIIGVNPLSSSYEFTLVSNDWNTRDSSHKIEKIKNIPKDYIVFKDFSKPDSTVLYYDNNVIKCFHQNKMDTLISIKKGELEIPDEIAFDISKKKERSKYIWGDYVYLNKDFLFIVFYYNNKKYYDMWDLHQNELLFRKSINEPKQTIGLIHLNDKPTNAWIRFVKNNKLYAVLEGNDEISEVDNQGNPIILELGY